MEEQHTCVKFCFKHWGTAPEMKKKKVELLLKTINHTAALPVQRSVLTTSTQYKANQIVCQEYVDLFLECDDTVHQQFIPPLTVGDFVTLRK